jgi:tryptophan-rich sensory protein
MNRLIKLIISLFLPVIVGGFSGYYTVEGVKDWYFTINKPAFTPPNELFGPVWTVLYILMGISLFRISDLPASKERNAALSIFGIQLLLNFLWSILFFKFHFICLALVDIVLLWGMIFSMILRFRKLDTWASYFQIPYLLWVSFASILNISILYLNG